VQEENMNEEQQRQIAEIFLWKSRFLFGIILRSLIGSLGTSQRKLGKEAIEYDNSLKERKFRYPGSMEGFPGRTGISRLINAKRPPTYGQVFVIFRVLKQHFDEIGEDFNEERQKDLWHLALFGSPREVLEAYEKYKGAIDEKSPEYIKARELHMRKMEEE
jgi:hypothetical protein